MSKMKNLNPKEKKAIQELKNRVQDAMTSPDVIEDALLHKMLKVRSFNIDKAEKMLRKHITWRKLHQVDNILEIFKPKEVFLKYIEPNFVGLDKEEDVVSYLHFGTIRSTEMLKCIKFNHYMNHFIWLAEKLIKQHSKAGKTVLFTVIMDLTGLEIANATSKKSADTFLGIVNTLQENYRQRIKSLYVINAPYYCEFVLKIIKAVMSHGMNKKIHVFGFSGWEEKLLEVIDENVLPAFLGGKRTDPDGDPYCRSFITMHDNISDRYYLSEEERYFKGPNKVSTLVLRPAEKKELSVQVKEVESSIHWTFMVESKTIGFGLFFEEKQKELKEIIPMHEYDTSDGTEEDSYRCSSVGKYVIIFDNSCSRFTTKEVKYILSVERPEGLLL